MTFYSVPSYIKNILATMEKLMTGEVSCRAVLHLCGLSMENFSVGRPKEGMAAGIIRADDSENLSPAG